MRFKIIALLLILSCLFIAMPSLAATTNVLTDAESFAITVDVGVYYSGSEVSIVIFAPSKGVGDFPEQDDGATKNIVPYINQGTVAENGKVEFTYKPSGAMAGRFTVITACKAAEYTDTISTPFATQDSVVNLIDSLKDTDDVADIFAASDNSDELAGYEILGFGNLTPAYDKLFTDNSIVTDAVKEKIYEDLLSAKGTLTAGNEKKEFQNAFTDSVFRNIVYMTKDTAKLRLFIDTYKSDLGLDKVAQYTSIYSAEPLNENGKADSVLGEARRNDIIKRMTDYAWSGQSISEICSVFAESCFLTAIDLDYSKSYDGMDKLINSESAYLTSRGADMAAYGSADSDEVCRLLSSALSKNEIKSIADFTTTLNQLSGVKDEPVKRPSGGNGGSGKGSAISGSSGTIVPEIKPSAEENASVYSDIENVSWAVESIEALTEMKVLSGKGNGKFYPDDNVTRAEFAKMITLAFGLYNEEAQCSFEDVSADAWYYSYVASAYENGIITGFDGKYAPEANITREDAAVIIGRVLEMSEISEAEKFADDNDISEYAKAAVYFLREQGIINGISETEFAPKALMSRAQAAKIIYGALNLKGGE